MNIKRKSKIRNRNYIKYKGHFKDSSGEHISFENCDQTGRIIFSFKNQKNSQKPVDF